MSNRSVRAASAVGVLALVAVGWGLQVTTAWADDELVPTVAVVDGEFQIFGPSGEPLKPAEVTGDAAERGLSGTYADGLSWSAWLLSALPPITPLTETEIQAREKAELHAPALGEPGPVVEGYLPSEITMDESELAPKFGYVVTSRSVAFAWPTDLELTAVYRDGTYVGDAVYGAFVDRNVTTGGVYEYSFDAPATENNASGLEHSQRVTIAIDPGSAHSVVVTPMAYQAYTTAYVHKTFIADEFVDLNPIEHQGCAVLDDPMYVVSFSGDDRSWLVPPFNTPYDTPNYRTEMFFNVNWDNPAPYQVVTVKDVGETSYYLNWIYQSSDYASMSGMTFDVSGSSSYVQVDLDHFAGNPYCTVGAIAYSETVDMYRSTGYVSVIGSGRPVPHHEAYFRYDTPSGYGVQWTYHIMTSNAGFGCLLGGCTPEVFNGSQTLPSV